MPQGFCNGCTTPGFPPDFIEAFLRVAGLGTLGITRQTGKEPSYHKPEEESAEGPLGVCQDHQVFVWQCEQVW